MSFRDVQRRSRQLAAKKAVELKGDTDKYRFRYWKITLGDGEKGTFIPMRDADGRYQIRLGVIAHRYGENWSYFACTADHPDFDGECAFCTQAERYQDTEEGPKVSTSELAYLGVWDDNYWEVYLDEGKTRWRLWKPRRPQDPPDNVVKGGKRFFRMGQNNREAWQNYVGELEDVCSCVVETNDVDISVCYVSEVRCPECRNVLYTDSELSKIGNGQKIRDEVLNRLHKCDPVEDGGCWDEEKERDEFEHMFFPEPTFSCLNHERNPDVCEGARPLDPFMRPNTVTRLGESTSTKYVWSLPKNMTWAEWAAYKLPEDLLSAFEEGIDLESKPKILSPSKQREEMEISRSGRSRTRGYKRGRR